MVDRPPRAGRRLGPLRKALPGYKVDSEGGPRRCPFSNFIWLVLGVLTVLEALNDLFGIAGPDWLYDNWIHQVILGASVVLVLARAAFELVARKAWMAFGVGLLLWFLGSAAWTAVYASEPNAPYPCSPTVPRLLRLLMALGIFYLIRVRVPQFELHRWMDGIAVTPWVLAVGFALVIQPATEDKTIGKLATFVVFLYPVLDVLLIGAILGVYGLMGGGPTPCGS